MAVKAAMSRFFLLGRFLLACAGLVVTACCSSGSGGPSTSDLPSTLVFSYPPIPLDGTDFTVPIGNLNPPDHTIPTDHAYFYHRLFHPSASFEVIAPAGGVVHDVTRGN